MVSVGVRRTSVRLSAAVRSFLVEFDCWFGESPTDSPAGKSVRLTSLTNMHRKVTGQFQPFQSQKFGILDRSSPTESDQSPAGKGRGV